MKVVYVNNKVINGQFIPELNMVELNEDLPIYCKVITLAHEVSHVLLWQVTRMEFQGLVDLAHRILRLVDYEQQQRFASDLRAYGSLRQMIRAYKRLYCW